MPAFSAMKTALVLCDPVWSTGSMAHDIAAVLTDWTFTLHDWSLPPSKLPELGAFDVVVCMTMTCAARVPALRKATNAVHLLLHPNELHLPEVQALAVQPIGSGVFGAVSAECVQLGRTAFPRTKIMYAPVAARKARFVRGEPRPIKRVGFVGFSVPEAVQVTGDSKRPEMFLAIAHAAGLQPVFSGKRYNYETVGRFYADVDLLISTSSTDGGPLPPFEAVACGIPFISTNVGCVKDSGMPGTFSTVEEAVALIPKAMELFAAQWAIFQNVWSWETVAKNYWEPLLLSVT